MMLIRSQQWWNHIGLMMLESLFAILVTVSIALPWAILLLARTLFGHQDDIPWVSFTVSSLTIWMVLRWLVEGLLRAGWISERIGCSIVVLMFMATGGSVSGFALVMVFVNIGEIDTWAELSNMLIGFVLYVGIFFFPSAIIGIPIGILQSITVRGIDMLRQRMKPETGS